MTQVSADRHLDHGERESTLRRRAAISDFADTMSRIESIIGFTLRLVGNGFEVLGVLIIIGGVVLTIDYVLRGLRHHISDDAHDKSTKIQLGRSLWLGLEILVAADIVSRSRSTSPA